MSRLTISLPAELRSMLDAEARRRGTPVSAVVQDALRQLFQKASEKKLAFAALGASGYDDTSENVDEILGSSEAWNEIHDR